MPWGAFMRTHPGYVECLSARNAGRYPWADQWHNSSARQSAHPRNLSLSVPPVQMNVTVQMKVTARHLAARENHWAGNDAATGSRVRSLIVRALLRLWSLAALTNRDGPQEDDANAGKQRGSDDKRTNRITRGKQHQPDGIVP